MSAREKKEHRFAEIPATGLRAGSSTSLRIDEGEKDKKEIGKRSGFFASL